MATQKRSSGADFWFVTSKGLPKLEEIEKDPRVNLSYFKDRTREWVSVSGEAEIVEDRKKIRELWAPDWKIWFQDEGGSKDGSAEDPRIVLIGVHVRTAQYMSLDKPQAVVLFDVVKSKLTGETPKIGDVKRVTITRGQASKRASAPSSRRRKGSTAPS
jgi:general stress protein 26